MILFKQQQYSGTARFEQVSLCDHWIDRPLDHRQILPRQHAAIRGGQVADAIWAGRLPAAWRVSHNPQPVEWTGSARIETRSPFSQETAEA
jgi:hypothetical protein